MANKRPGNGNRPPIMPDPHKAMLFTVIDFAIALFLVLKIMQPHSSIIWRGLLILHASIFILGLMGILWLNRRK